jgi:peptidase A4-like protein
MFHLSRKTARAAMGAIGLLVLLVLLAACGSGSPTLLSNSLQHAASGVSQGPRLAGYLAGAQGTYTDAEVTFTVPSFQQPVGGPKVAYAAMLSGNSRAIVDAGIYSYLDPSGNQINKAYWEFNSPITGLSQTEELPLSGGSGAGVVSPGDQIDAYASSNYQGSWDDYFLIQDLTTGDSGSYTLPGNIVDASSAGCVVLVPLTNPQPPADFGTVNVQRCQVSLSQGNNASTKSTISNFQPIPTNMVNGGFGASPSSPIGEGGDFSVTWQNFQPQGN